MLLKNNQLHFTIKFAVARTPFSAAVDFHCLAGHSTGWQPAREYASRLRKLLPLVEAAPKRHRSVNSEPVGKREPLGYNGFSAAARTPLASRDPVCVNLTLGRSHFWSTFEY